MKPLTIPKLKKKVWKIFSQYIRQKYADKNGYVNCYTCGVKKHWKEQQCGHGLGGRGNSILFDEELVRVQCPQCNIFKGGNYDVFHAKLIEENGLKWFNDKLKLKHTTKQFTRKELEMLYEKYKTIIIKKVNGYDVVVLKAMEIHYQEGTPYYFEPL